VVGCCRSEEVLNSCVCDGVIWVAIQKPTRVYCLFSTILRAERLLCHSIPTQATKISKLQLLFNRFAGCAVSGLAKLKAVLCFFQPSGPRGPP